MARYNMVLDLRLAIGVPASETTQFEQLLQAALCQLDSFKDRNLFDFSTAANASSK